MVFPSGQFRRDGVVLTSDTQHFSLAGQYGLKKITPPNYCNIYYTIKEKICLFLVDNTFYGC